MMIFGLALGEWVTILQGILAFPATVLQIVKLLQKTPAEKHADIVTQVNAAITASQASASGRPTWESP